ncbi:sigma-70 family RNA polymerase sigma factor [Nocardioides sp. BGMRC 2183]|nr:sigma-70 family RNA polymerase sigma factor [Nocardioides sp. BGMRC 2183]
MTRSAVPDSGVPDPGAPADRDDDREARFRGMYQTNFSAVLGYALRRTAQQADASDVVAETFLVAWRRFDDAPPGDARPWLFGVARHVLANHHRSGRRRERLGGRLRSTLTAESAPDPAVGVAETDRVRRALLRIGPDDRELLMLVGWDGLTPTEAAAALGIKPGTARMRLARARARMRELLGDAGSGAGHVPGVPTLHATGLQHSGETR